MKLTIAILVSLAVIVGIQGGPISVSGNNVGDITTVGVNAQATLSNNVEANIITAIIALLNQQIGIVATGSEQSAESIPQVSDFTSLITPEVVNEVKNIKITPEMIEEFKKLLKKNGE